ncbi:cupin domain-containing protein [Chloroflexota bacterium]
MQLFNINKVSEQPMDVPLMTGGPVTRQALFNQQNAKSMYISQINFSKGARNKFHSHTDEQLLVVTAGKGIVATEQEEVEVTVGDVILFSPGEKHWHGATRDSAFSHYAISLINNQTTQLED